MGPYYIPASRGDDPNPEPGHYHCSWYAPGASGGVNIDGGAAADPETGSDLRRLSQLLGPRHGHDRSAERSVLGIPLQLAAGYLRQSSARCLRRLATSRVAVAPVARAPEAVAQRLLVAERRRPEAAGGWSSGRRRSRGGWSRWRASGSARGGGGGGGRGGGGGGVACADVAGARAGTSACGGVSILKPKEMGGITAYDMKTGDKAWWVPNGRLQQADQHRSDVRGRDLPPGSGRRSAAGHHDQVARHLRHGPRRRAVGDSDRSSSRLDKTTGKEIAAVRFQARRVRCR